VAEDGRRRAGGGGLLAAAAAMLGAGWGEAGGVARCGRLDAARAGWRKGTRGK